MTDALRRFMAEHERIMAEHERASAEERATAEATDWLDRHPERVLDGSGGLRCPYDDCAWTHDAARPRLRLAAHLADQHPEGNA